MKIDCTNLECPKPVINTKNALEELGDEGVLEVMVNSLASKENVERFAKSQGCDVSIKTNGDVSTLTIAKGFTCNVVSQSEAKSIFIKNDRVGEGELGEKLIVGFLHAMNELKTPPKEIICVNKGVFLTTKNEDSIKALQALMQKGVKVYSCGVCLEFYDLKLKVGEIGNAYSTVESLTTSNGVISL